MNGAPLTLSRARLTTFLACSRRFQLRVVDQLAWPQRPLTPANEARFARGRQFHQLLQRHFLGLPVDKIQLEDERLRRWWDAFQSAPLPVHQPGTALLLPELTLTVPIDGHLLHGRFDLLLLHVAADGQPTAHIFDWKTGKPPAGAAGQSALRYDWQTRLYLALLAESGRALTPLPGAAISPAQIRLTYWFVADPQAPHTIRYNQAEHDQNLADLRSIVADIAQHLDRGGIWPLTSDWEICRTCAYHSLCGRTAAGHHPAVEDEDSDAARDEPVADLEPQLP